MKGALNQVLDTLKNEIQHHQRLKAKYQYTKYNWDSGSAKRMG